MRRHDREVVGLDELEAVMRRCGVCRLALNGDGYPYIVPLNFGYVRRGDAFALYFHCAGEGWKLDLIKRDGRAAFEMESVADIVRAQNACGYTMAYESLAGQGSVTVVGDDEKAVGMEALMRQCAPGQSFAFSAEMLAGVTVLRLDVERMTGKRNLPRASEA